MLIEALRNGVRRTAKPRLLFSRRVSTSSTKNLLHPLLVLRLSIECLETDTTTSIFGKTRKCIVDCAVRVVPTDHRGPLVVRVEREEPWRWKEGRMTEQRSAGRRGACDFW